MQRIRIDRKALSRPREERYPALPLDARDGDVVRAKEARPPLTRRPRAFRSSVR